MTQTEEFISQNVAYGPTVYKTGLNSTGVKFVHRICKLPTYRQSCVRLKKSFEHGWKKKLGKKFTSVRQKTRLV